jgi:hypothetical protein
MIGEDIQILNEQLTESERIWQELQNYFQSLLNREKREK